MTTLIGPGACRPDRSIRTPDHVVALLRERRRRLAAIPRYDRYIAEAAGDLSLQAFWRNLRRQDLEDAQRIAARLGREPARPMPAARPASACRAADPDGRPAGRR